MQAITTRLVTRHVTRLFRSARRGIEPRSRRFRRFATALAPFAHVCNVRMAWQITICSRCDAAGHLRRCWRTRLRDAFAAQTVSVIVRGCRAASACVFQPRAGVAGFASDAARLSLANELCAARPPSLNARALSQQVLPGGLTYKVWQPHGDARLVA